MTKLRKISLVGISVIALFIGAVVYSYSGSEVEQPIIPVLAQQFISGSSMVSIGDNNPVMIEISGIEFDVDTTGVINNEDGVITEFIDNIYMAHNNLAGKYFGGDAEITYANGSVIEYMVDEIIIMQALDPFSGSTNYTDGVYLYTANDIHRLIFSRGVVFVTCYQKDDNASWGRKFVIMEEVNK
jgi:hypothetical protein